MSFETVRAPTHGAICETARVCSAVQCEDWSRGSAIGSDQGAFNAVPQSRPGWALTTHNDQRCPAVSGGTRPTMGTTRPLPAAVVLCPRGAVRAPVAGAVPTASRIEEYAAALVEAMPRVGQNQARRSE